jgi:hypothetical protein
MEDKIENYLDPRKAQEMSKKILILFVGWVASRTSDWPIKNTKIIL